MTRDQFLALLTHAVQEGWLTVEEAIILRSRFDRRLLDEQDLPLMLEDAIDASVSEEDEALALLALAAVLGVVRDQRAIESVLVRRVPDNRDIAQAVFQVEVRGLARVAGANVQNWHQRMQAQVRQHILQQATLGHGRTLTGAELQALEPVIQRELVYLSRFAEEISTKRIAGRPLSEAQIGARSELYAGAGRAEWFKAHESELDGDYVVDYQAQDDAGTCSPCLDAEGNGPYLPSQGPYPGIVCRGHGRCRCKRVERYAPEEAQRLRGTPALTNR